MNLLRAKILAPLLLSCLLASFDANALENDTDKWRFVIIGDTQTYMASDSGAEIFKQSLKNLVDRRTSLGIQGFFHMGDIVDDNTPTQWDRARVALEPLIDTAPSFIALGNHDLGESGLAKDRNTLFNSTLAAHFKNRKDIVSTFEEGKFENTAYRLAFGQENFLILVLEFAPRDEVLEWAKRVEKDFVKDHSSARTILVTHEYMDEASAYLSQDGKPYPSDRKIYGNAHHYTLGKTSKNNGSEILEKLIRPATSFEFVFSGHYDDALGIIEQSTIDRILLKSPKPITNAGAAFTIRSDRLENDRNLHQLMYNTQWIPNGGDGWFLIIEGSHSNRSHLRIRNYSPWLSELGGKRSQLVEGELIDTNGERK